MTGSDFGISVTGVAGPSPSEGKPVGLVYIGFAQKDVQTSSILLCSYLAIGSPLNIEQPKAHSINYGNS